MNTRPALTLAVAILLLTTAAEAKRVLFYEVGTGGDYTIESGYSDFAKELKNKGYDVASITKGELTKESLENYDMLIIPNMGKTLSTAEVSAIIEFVLQKGRAIYLAGAGPSANQITIPFGVTIDEGVLIDPTDQIPALNDRNSFTIDRFGEYPGMSTIRQGVTKIGFYQGSGIKVSGSARIIAQGNSDTYSDTGSFASGSYPPVAAAAIFGNGLVFMTSDADFLTNKYIGDYNNKRFGLNIIDWLSISESAQPGNSTQELQYIIAEKKLEIARLESQVKQLGDEKNSLLQQNSMLSRQLADTQQQVLDIQSGMIGPLSKTNWAIVALGVCVLFAAIIISKKKQVTPIATTAPVKDEDILNELGYELDKADKGKTSAAASAKKDLDSELDNIKL
ncbi:MAG: hypothetical protein NTU61_02580 [Candidatus Altiarchaeota archaeon]|nr:hypothetical protein [Candidatus Altiarchaeota archaeon]